MYMYVYTYVYIILFCIKSIAYMYMYVVQSIALLMVCTVHTYIHVALNWLRVKISPLQPLALGAMV